MPKIVNVQRQLDKSMIQAAKHSMATAMLANDADRAKSARKRFEQLAPLVKPAFAHVANLADWTLLLALASPVRDRARIALARHGRLLHVADVDPANISEIESAWRAAAHAAQAPPPPALDPDRIDTIALLTRWLFLPKKKLHGWSARLDLSPVDPTSLQRAAKSILRGDKGATVESHEIEGVE